MEQRIRSVTRTDARRLSWHNYYTKNAPEIIQRVKDWRSKNRDAINLRYKQQLLEIKLDVLGHYGYPIKCVCCGEFLIDFLGLDHIERGSNAHRRLIGCATGKPFYCWIKRNNYPKGYQISCLNCNMAREHQPDRVCPHQKQ